MNNFNIVKPENSILKQFVEYFLFIQYDVDNAIKEYTTFPNSNSCIALYKNNHVHWDRKLNTCSIVNSNDAVFESKLYAWHNKPFKVTITGQLDQICIIFSNTGLSQFTKKPLNTLSVVDDPFSEIFGKEATYFQQRLFETSCNKIRAGLLESFLLNKLVWRPTPIVNNYIRFLKSTLVKNGSKVHDFCRDHHISESTLYRSCREYIGESPKDIKSKLRFRLFIDYLNTTPKLTDIAYLLNYTDQAHLIKEVKKFTGLTPKKLATKMSVKQDALVLIN